MGKLLLSQIVGTNIAYYRFTLDYFLDAMDELGIHQIELWGGSNHLNPYDGVANAAAKMKKKLDERGFRCISLMPEQNVYSTNIAVPEKYIRDKSVEYCKWFIEAAGEMGVDRYLLNPGRPCLDKPWSEGYKWARDSIERMLPLAEKNGVTLMYENLNDRESRLATNLEDLSRMAFDIDSDYLGVCVDTVPVACVNEKLEDYFAVLGDKVKHIHLNDGRPWGHMKWGDGFQDLDEHLNAMRKYDYTGYINLEIDNGSYLMDPNTHYKLDLEYVIPHFDGGELV